MRLSYRYQVLSASLIRLVFSIAERLQPELQQIQTVSIELYFTITSYKN